MTAARIRAAPRNGYSDIRAQRDRLAGWLALAGAWLGVLAGVFELTVGPSVRGWVGNKLDTTRLGWATIVLSVVALATARSFRRRPNNRVATALGLLVPALICFTTVGRLWYLPGTLLLVGGALVVAGTHRDALAHAIEERHWRNGLVVLCGAYYIFLGVTALGFAGIVGVLGGLLVWASVRFAARSPVAAYGLLLTGALPFAALTWWSVITPLIAILTLVLGRRVVRDGGAPGLWQPHTDVPSIATP